MKVHSIIKFLCVTCFGLFLMAFCAIAFVYESPSMFYKFGIDKELLRLGKVFGLMAGALLIFQPVFVCRFKWLDRVFGQDRLIVYHRNAAIVLTGFAFLHPLFILWAENFTFFPMELRYWPAFLGMVLLFLVSVLTGVSFFRSRIGLKWNAWMVVHRGMAPLIMIAFLVHVSKVSKPFETGVLHVLILITTACLAGLFVRKWVLNYTSIFKHKYQVTGVEPLTDNAWAVNLKPVCGNALRHLPGQFAYITALGKHVPKEEHPFTIASSPATSGELQFIIRSCGDFTRQISKLAAGEMVLIDGPYGRFSHLLFENHSDLVMIAGGIGVTPMLSMLRALRSDGNTCKVLFIWSNKTEDDIVLKDEFISLAKENTHLEIHHVFTRMPGHSRGFHRIDKQCLEKLFIQVDPKAPLMLCGPPEMQRALKKVLKSPGFSSHKVYTESFVL